MSRKTRSVAGRKLARFERAIRDHEMKGSMHPEDWDDVEREYQEAKEGLRRFIWALLEDYGSED